MRLHRLTLTAFGPFATRQTVDFDALSAAGLFLLHGPTGAGKTTILDAVCYALYGRVPGSRERFTGALRSDHADPHTPTEVVLDLTVAGRRLEVTRRPEQPRPKRRGTGTTVEKAFTGLREHDPRTGTWRPVSRSHQEVGEEIRQLLGMSREQFCQVVLLPQGQFARFLHADAEARGRLLGRLFDTGHFADAEAHLAERRRATADTVAKGDAALLRLAHRTAQAAGGCADLADHPLPELTPGAPGLADTVLAWAAVARASAREHLAVAEVAADAAQAAHRAAQQAAETTAQLAALQRRHAEAARQATDLERRRPEIETLRARLERARAAEAVAPVLAVRTAAEAALQAAVEAEHRAREQLPRDHAGCDAAQLTAEEQRLRAELGGLDALHRAEERIAALRARRTRLEQETRGHEEALREAEEWLAAWDDHQAALQRAVDDAGEALARAEQLAGRLEPARGRLAAARERDRLTDRLQQAEAELSRLDEAAAQARQHWLDVRERRLDGMAAELARTLRDGRPCPVCGAAEHPSPAPVGQGHVDRAAEDAARAAHESAEEARRRAEETVRTLRENLAAATAEAGTTPVADLAAEVERLTADHRRARAAAAEAGPAREALERARREHAARLAQRREAGERHAACTSEREALLAEEATLEEELAQARGDAASVAERAADLRRQAARCAEAAEAARAVERAAAHLKEADGQLVAAAQRAGFATPQDAAEALLDPEQQKVVRARVDQWHADTAAAAAVLADPETAAAAARPAADPDAARSASAAAGDRWQRACSALDAARARCAALDQLGAEAAAEARRLAPLRAHHEVVSRLAALTAGTSAENERRMRLESYVLAARLEQVAAAASVRLAEMSAGRYTLVHSDERSTGRGRHGLGLRVVDAWTGRERDTATLSGGETFFASLALALGLADVVAAESGGTRLDTLFVDEGFGTLDEQTLDEVMDVLDGLRERDRCVGIVSHVADLRRRIPARLEVVRTRRGSAVRQHAAPTDG